MDLGANPGLHHYMEKMTDLNPLYSANCFHSVNTDLISLSTDDKKWQLLNGVL